MSHFSVTTPATEVCLLTAEELRAAAGVSGGAQDAQLLAIGRGASTAIARRCCIVDDGVNPPTLLEETCEEIFRWSACGPMRLARRPVTEIISITINGGLVPGEGYEVSAGRNVYRLSGNDLIDWAGGRIAVTYKAGYASAPLDLKLAASKLVTALWSEQGRDPSLKREDIPGVMEREYWVAPSADPLLSREIVDLISPYAEIWI